jgi:lipopolysaccharide biosynthesis glycosyltransferase
LFFNNDGKIHVYLLSDNLSRENIEEIDLLFECFGNRVTYKYIDMTNFYNTYMNSQINVDSRFTRYTLYRLAMPYLILDERILYVDADGIIVSNISDFYNMDFKDNWIVGCEDTGLQKGYKNKIGLKNTDTYINAGVALLNMHEIRKIKIADEWLKLCNNTPFEAHDQDIWNLTCFGRIGVVDAQYNVSLSTSLNYKPNEIKILHMAGAKKQGADWVKYIPFSEIWYEWESRYKKSIKEKENIPRTITYCWFGKGEKPEKIKKCIVSWKKVMPDYKIIEINEDTVDVNCNEFVQDAYKAKKYAFLNDYFRFKYMYENGGITMDADCEAIRSLDCFLVHRFFTGQEVDGITVCATMGCEKGHPLAKFIMDYYDMAKFDVNKMIPNTQIITKIMSLFIKKKENGKIILEQDCHIYPQDFFAPYDHIKLKEYRTDNTHTIHKFCGSWK